MTKKRKRSRRRKSKKGCSLRRVVAMVIVGMVFFVVGYEVYRFVNNREKPDTYDEKWPYHDLTSGEYSGGYDGIDISRHQGKIRWQELRKVGRLKFVYVKITEGAATKDPWFERNVDSVRASGFLVGAYHFMTKSPATLQFENFRANYDIDRQDLLPVVDVEDDGTRGWSREEIQSCLKTFCSLFSNYYGRTPIIYCSESYYKDYLSPDFDNYLLWIASYGHEPTLPGAPHYDIWQKSRRGRVPGVWNWVDLNRMGAGHVVEDFKW